MGWHLRCTNRIFRFGPAPPKNLPFIHYGREFEFAARVPAISVTVSRSRVAGQCERAIHNARGDGRRELASCASLQRTRNPRSTVGEPLILLYYLQGTNAVLDWRRRLQFARAQVCRNRFVRLGVRHTRYRRDPPPRRPAPLPASQHSRLPALPRNGSHRVPPALRNRVVTRVVDEATFSAGAEGRRSDRPRGHDQRCIQIARGVHGVPPPAYYRGTGIRRATDSCPVPRGISV